MNGLHSKSDIVNHLWPGIAKVKLGEIRVHLNVTTTNGFRPAKRL